MAGIYLHVPFCKQACHYCDFHFSTSLKFRDRVLWAMQKELENRASELGGQHVSSIYFGGGTPSLLSKKELSSLLGIIYERFDVQKDAEITLEANPDDLSREKLDLLRESGINRLSIGIQSFREKDLSLMNRAHSRSEALNCLKLARESGFDHFSLDLIYGIPELSEKDWGLNIETALEFCPDHISAYCLTIEKKTAFHHFIKSGKMSAPQDQESSRHYDLLCERMSDAGYRHYEVSNFCIPGKESRHNSGYWSGQPYLGIGPSAHSYSHPVRSWNIANNAKYVNAMEEGRRDFSKEELSNKDRANELIMTGLRRAELLAFEALLELSYPLDQFRESLSQFADQGWITLSDTGITPTEKGFWWSDRMSAELFWV
jgi:oxygen-independent coproporphyrinogen-3 oxidase